MPHTLYLALGTNLGDKEKNIQTAIQKIQETIGTVQRQSSLFTTKPQGFQSQNLFINAALKVQTDLTPQQCLQKTQQIEQEMGRHEKTTNQQYKDRIIDIDILLYDNLHLQTPTLQIPHPRMHQRPFVMQPLRQILD